MLNRDYYKALAYWSLPDLKSSDLKNNNYNLKLDLSQSQKWFEDNKLKFQIYTWEYHFKFQNVKSKPYIIYYIGDINLLNKQLIWIVWPRFHSLYWQDFVTYFLQKTKNYSYCTISWMAPWIDTICHEYSIDNNIKTIAVIWWWIRYYQNSKFSSILKKILDNWWLVISEFKFDTVPTKYTFPQRNRIVAWLSDFIIVPEAWKGSWSLITADFSLACWKKVYWLMWDVYSHFSYWINEYISENKAIAIYDIDKFIQNIFPETDNFDKIWLNEIQLSVLDFVTKNPCSNFMTIQFALWYTTNELLAIISILEINWLIKQINPWEYST